MIGDYNRIIRNNEVSPSMSPEYPGLSYTTFNDIELAKLIPNFNELWDYTRKKIVAAGVVSISIYNTNKSTLFSEQKPQALAAIVVPTFNVEDFILETLLSIKMQTYAPMHIIIVDDNSTDSTRDKVLNFMNEESDKLSISFVQIPINVGNPGFTRNFGLFNLLLPKTEYVAFMDGDDVYATDQAVETLAVALNSNKDTIAAVGDYDWISEAGKPLARATSIQSGKKGRVVWKENKRLTWHNFARRRLGPYHLQCLMVRCDAPYIPYRPQGEDAEYYMRLFAMCARKGCDLNELILEVPMLIAHYRKRSKSISQAKDPAFSPKPPPKSIQMEQRPPNVPPLYIAAQIPERYITDKAISEWAARRLTFLFFGDLRSNGFPRAFTHVKAAWKDRRIRKADLARIPFLHLWAAVKSIVLAGNPTVKTTKNSTKEVPFE